MGAYFEILNVKAFFQRLTAFFPFFDAVLSVIYELDIWEVWKLNSLAVPHKVSSSDVGVANQNPESRYLSLFQYCTIGYQASNSQHTF